jgi:hypothetical protein
VVGLNPLEPDFWDRGFQMLEGLMEEFKALL